MLFLDGTHIEYDRGRKMTPTDPKLLINKELKRSRSPVSVPPTQPRARSRSPGRTRVSSEPMLSPTESGSIGRLMQANITRSANITPTSTPSPKKRQLPQIPVHAQQINRDKGLYELQFAKVEFSGIF